MVSVISRCSGCVLSLDLDARARRTMIEVSCYFYRTVYIVDMMAFADLGLGPDRNFW